MLLLKTNPWKYKIKDLNGEKIIGSFCEKELLQIKVDDLDVGKLKTVSVDLKKNNWCSSWWSCLEYKI